MSDADTPKTKPKKSAIDKVLKLAIALALFTIAGVIGWRNFQQMGKPSYPSSYDTDAPQRPNNRPQRPGLANGNGNGNPNRPGAGQGQGQGQGQNLGPLGHRMMSLRGLQAIPWGDNDAGTRIQRETLTADDRLWTDTAGHVTAGKLLAIRDDFVVLQRYGLVFIEPRSSFGKADAAYLAAWDARIAAFRQQATSKDPEQMAAAAALLPGNPVLTASCIDQVMLLCNEQVARVMVVDPELNPYSETVLIPTAFDAFMALAVLPPTIMDTTQELQYSQVARGSLAALCKFMPDRSLPIAMICRNLVILNLVAPRKDVTPTDAETLKEWLTDLRRNPGQAAICQYIATSSAPDVAPTYPVLLANSQQAPRVLWLDYQRALQRAGLAAQVQKAAESLSVQGNVSQANQAARARQRALTAANRNHYTGFFDGHGLATDVDAALDDIETAEMAKDSKLILATCEWLWGVAPQLGGLYWQKAQAVHLEYAKAAAAAGKAAEASRQFQAAAQLGPLEERAAIALAQERAAAGDYESAWALLISSVKLDSLSDDLAAWMAYIQQRTVFKGPYATQQEWIESALAADLADMIGQVGGRQPGAANITATASIRVTYVEDASKLERRLHVEIPGVATPLGMAVPSYPHHLFSSLDWQGTVAAIADAMGVAKPAAGGRPLDAVMGQRLLSETATLNPESLAKLDLALSASLAAAPGDPQQHEFAALLLLTMAMREVMPYLGKPEDAYIAAAAHLAMARWLNGGAFASPVGILADAALNQQLGRKAAGQALLAAAPVLWEEAEAPWRRMLALDASRDTRGLAPITEQAAIVQLTYLQVQQQNDRPPTNMLNVLERLLNSPEGKASPELVYQGIPDGAMGIGMDKAGVKTLLSNTIAEWRAVRSLYVAGPTGPADMQVDFTQLASPPVDRPAETAIVGWTRWCGYYERRMNAAFKISLTMSTQDSGIAYDMAAAIAKEFPRLMALSPDAEAVKSLISNGTLANLERLPAYRAYVTTKPEALAPALWREFEGDLINYGSDRGTMRNSDFDGFGHRYGWAPRAEAKGDFAAARLEDPWPSMMRWIGTQPLPGTTHGAVAGGEALISVDPDFMTGEDATMDAIMLLTLQLDPYQPENLVAIYERRKAFPDEVTATVLAAIDHMKDYSPWAKAWSDKRDAYIASSKPRTLKSASDNIADMLGDAAEEAVSEKEMAYKTAMATDPSQAVSYGKWLWLEGRRDEAIAMWDSYSANAKGDAATTMSFFIPKILGYLTGSGSATDRLVAHRLAERAAAAGSSAGLDAYCTIQMHEGSYAAAFDTATRLAKEFGQTQCLKMVTDYAALHGDRSLIPTYRALLIDIHQNPRAYYDGGNTPTSEMAKYRQSNDPIVGGLRVKDGATRAPSVGMRAGDLFVAMNGWAMRELTDFYAALSLDSKPTVQMTVLRGDELLTYDSPAPRIDVDADLEPADPDHLRSSPNPALQGLEMRLLAPSRYPGAYQLGGVGDNNGRRTYAIPPEPGSSHFYTYQTDATTRQTQLYHQDLETPGPPVAVGPLIDPPLVPRLVGTATVGDTVYVAGNIGLDTGVVLKITPTTVTRLEPDKVSLAGAVSNIVAIDGQVLVGFVDKTGSRGGLVRVNPDTDSFEMLYGVSTGALPLRQAKESTLGVHAVLLDPTRGVVWFDARSVSKSRNMNSLGIFSYSPGTKEITQVLNAREVDGSLLSIASDGTFILSGRRELATLNPDTKERQRFAVSRANSQEEATYTLDGWLRDEFWQLGDLFVRQHEGLLVLRQPGARLSTILRYGMDSQPLDDQIKLFQYGDSVVLFGHGSGQITLLRRRSGGTTSPGWVDCASLVPKPTTTTANSTAL